MTRVATAAILAGMALAACSGGNPTATAPVAQHRTLVVNDSSTEICVAVATTTGQQAAGLSHRPSIPPQEGLAFLFSPASLQEFDMRDTSVPLAIVWVGPEGRVLGSTALTPQDATAKPSPAPIILAVELSPQDWNPISATARTITLGEACEGTIVPGRPGTAPSEF